MSTRVLLTGNSMVKYMYQYLNKYENLTVLSFPGIKTEHLFDRIASALTCVDVIIVHVGTNNTLDSKNGLVDKFHLLLEKIRSVNSKICICISGVLPRKATKQVSCVDSINKKYMHVNNCICSICKSEGYLFWLADRR